MRKFRIGVAIVAGIAMIAPASAAVAQSRADDPDRPVAEIVSAATPASKAKEIFSGRVDDLARHNGMSMRTMRAVLDDDTAWVDEDARLYYEEPMAADAQKAPQARVSKRPGKTTGGAAPTAPALSSLPGANRTIYIDFTGHTITGTRWNVAKGIDPVVVTPYDTDGNPSTFSAAETAVITETWQRIAEDYAPFNVNVTTVDPGADAINRSSTTDDVYGTRLLVDPTSWYQSGCGCGGVAYVGVFDSADNGYYQPALVFTQGVGNGAKNIAEAGSHEVGHNLGLSHDGTDSVGYYGGQGAWAPIMGVGYYKAISQWSKGEYANANNTEDDYAVMTANGLGFRGADNGQSLAAATPITPGVVKSGVNASVDDVDYFKVTLAAGTHTFKADPAAVGANLDINLVVFDQAGTQLAAWNPPSGQLSSGTATGLNASGTLNLPAGTYYIRVDDSGYGDPLTTGYSTYGSAGQFTLLVN